MVSAAFVADNEGIGTALSTFTVRASKAGMTIFNKTRFAPDA
jgi:hypothetical protein